jgi:hypothetical protein
MTNDDDDLDEPEDVAEVRYVLAQAPHGAWAIIDTFSSLTAATNGRELTDLDYQDAKDIADMLNREHAANKSPLI